MLKKYLTVAFRNISKNKGYFFINIVGLALGLAVFSLVASFVEFHFSFDEFHKDADSIYSVVQILLSGEGGERHTARTGTPLMQYLLNDFPEIKDATRLIPLDEYVVGIATRSFMNGRALPGVWIRIFCPSLLLVTFFAVIFQTYKAATANPVSSLRYE